MMNPMLLQKLAVALTVSQIFTAPDNIKDHFDPVNDQKQVLEIMQGGCKAITSNIREVLSGDAADDFKIENLKVVFDLIDKNSAAAKNPMSLVKGLSWDEISATFNMFCLGKPNDSLIKLDEVIQYYDDALASVKDMRDPKTLKDLKHQEASLIYGSHGERFTEVYSANNRRRWVNINDIADNVKNAFIAAEDKNFFKHHGVEQMALLRAAAHNAQGGDAKDQGGSTITQQMVKNYITGNAPDFKRKIQEMVIATRIEVGNCHFVDNDIKCNKAKNEGPLLTKDQILELYLNQIYLGDASWGADMAAASYYTVNCGKVKCGKTINKNIPNRQLTLVEAAQLGGLPKNPIGYDPLNFPEDSKKRTKYVLKEMKNNGYIKQPEFDQALAQLDKTAYAAFESPRNRGGFYAVSEIIKSAVRDAKIDPLSEAVDIHSTVDPVLQRAVDAAVQEWTAKYEMNYNRVRFSGAEKNIAEAIAKINKNAADQNKPLKLPAWQMALKRTSAPLYDVAWPIAVITSTGKITKVGLRDGRELRLTAWDARVGGSLKLYDVVHVAVNDAKGTADLRFRPIVQGAAIVLRNSDGGVVAVTGGFSFPANQFNRAMSPNALRQPGSAVKPLTYIAALKTGIQPNSAVMDQPTTISARGYEEWSVRNDNNDPTPHVTTIRYGLENSKNQVAAELLNHIVEGRPDLSLKRVRSLMTECGLDDNPTDAFPVIIGGFNKGVRMVNLATCYATIANLGVRPNAHVIDSIDKDGVPVRMNPAPTYSGITSADQVSLLQMRGLMQGVVTRGTLYRMTDNLKDIVPKGHTLSEFLAAKTGTTQKANDVWVAGFTPEYTIVTWIGYDNSKERLKDKRGKWINQTLGSNATGARVAEPMFEAIFRAVAKNYPLHAFPEPSGPLARDVAAFAERKADGLLFNIPKGPLPEGYAIDYIRLNQGQPVQGPRIVPEGYGPGTDPTVPPDGDPDSPMVGDPEQVYPGQPGGYQRPGYQPPGYQQQPGHGQPNFFEQLFGTPPEQSPDYYRRDPRRPSYRGPQGQNQYGCKYPDGYQAGPAEKEDEDCPTPAPSQHAQGPQQNDDQDVN
jgi:penicillin-binding protein 1A